MKRMMVFLTAVMMLLTMSACGSKETAREEVAVQKPESVVSDTAEVGEEDTVTDESEDTSTEIIEEENSSANPVIPMSDNLDDFTISIDGIVYQLPCSTEIFFNDGWKLGGYETLEEALALEKYFEPEEGGTIVFTHKESNHRICVLLENRSGQTEQFLKSTVVGLYDAETEEQAEIVIAGGLVLDEDLTADEIIDVLGTDYSQKDSDYTYVAQGGHYRFEEFDSGIYWNIEKKN